MFPIGNEGIVHMKSSFQGKVIIICAYSPTLAVPEEDKGRFLQALEEVIKNITKTEHV